MTKINQFRQVFAALMFILALAIGQNAWAQNTTWTVGGTGNSFTITRSGDISSEVTVSYRTVSLSAVAGHHFIEATGTVTIPANQASSESISVTEMTPSDDSYNFQTTTQRTYRFEALDLGGFELAHRDRNITYSTTYQHTNTYVNRSVTDLVYFTDGGSIQSGSGNKYKDVTYSNTSDWTQIKDSGYSQWVGTASTNELYHSSSPLRTYLNNRSTKMYATVYFTQKEEHDGYQYIQIYTGSYDSGDDPNGGVNAPVNSLYKACFILSKKASVMSNAHYQFFPHRYNYHNKAEEKSANITHYEFDYDDSYLYEQKYKATSYQASTSGSLILSTTTNNIHVRFDAGGGGNDHDEWDFKNLKVRLALVDGTAPTVINSSAIAVNPGNHCNGNDFYISVPFNEIVTIEGSTKKLTTSWGDATYIAGSGSNVLTFKGTISAEVNKALKITGKSGTITDLAGNSFSGSLNKNFSTTVEASYSYSIAYTLNNGTLPLGYPTTYTYDAATTLMNPTRAGYTFAGWTGSNGDTPETTVTIAAHSHGYVSYTANWSIITYNLSYDLAGGSVATANPTTYTVVTPDFTLVNPTRAGYTFAGWTGSNGNTPQTTVTIAQGSIGDRTYSASWSVNHYTVQFDANATNGIAAAGTMANQSFVYDEAQTLTANAFSRTGYTFAGWNTAADGSGTAYTDGQSVINLTAEPDATVTLYAQWDVIPWEGAGTSADEPYLIVYPSQLLKLADDVNGGTDTYYNKYFKLGNDIDMGGVTFNGIGNFDHSFDGHFNGNNKTISNLTINSSNDCKGLFGQLYGNVHDLILDGANILGRYQVAGIAGYARGTISNCLVINSSITYTWANDGGVIAGFNYYSTLTQNYYRNCSVTKDNNTNTTNIGVGDGVGDRDGARSLHTLSLPEHVTATSTETKVIGDVTYYASNVTVTLTPEQGFTLTDVTVNGVAATAAGNGTWTFSMPAADATVSCGNSVTYIDANGNPQSCTNFAIIQSSNGNVIYGTEGQECWFVVNSAVTINGMLILQGSSQNLILCDGASLNIARENDKAIQSDGSSSTFSIYGQTNGTGCINSSSTDDYVPCIQVSGNLVINGGSVSATSSGNHGIHASSSVTINGGSVSATGGSGYGIHSNGDITLGWRNLSDRIYASSYYKPYKNSFVVKAGQYLSDGTEVYSGNQGSGGALAGKTLQPCFSLTLPAHVVATSGTMSHNNGLFALPAASVTVAPAEGYTLAEVTVNSIAATDNGDGTWSFSMPGANATVSATVTAITYHITYNLGGGSVATANPETYTIESGDITLNNPTRTSFTFTGWNGTDLTEPTMSVTIPAGSTGDRSYSATWSPNIALLWGSGNGSQNAPYIITTPEGLDLLATLVNEGNNYYNYHFELGEDITYNKNVDDNYTPIGISGNIFFAGTFDGKGYTISGIRITTVLYSFYGLFGNSDGLIRNVILNDMEFTFSDYAHYVGGIVGFNSGEVSNCLVKDSEITTSSGYPDAIAGYSYGILNGNYYYNCIISGSNESNCYTLRGDATTNVVFDGYTDGIVYDNVLYAPYYAFVNLTLSYNGEVPAGYAPVFVPKDDYSTVFAASSNNCSLIMPLADVTITALLGKTNVPYLDENGAQQTCPVAIEIESDNGNSDVHYHGGWYVVNSNVTINKHIEFHDDAHLILSDGHSISALGINGDKSLTVYAQSEGNDKGVCQASLNCGALTINGGKFTGNISVNKGDLVINSGLVVTSSISAQYGGSGSGVCNITLGWRSENDRISATSYTIDDGGTLKIKDGQYYFNGSELLSGTISDMSKIDDKTLIPFPNSVAYIDANGVQQTCTDFTIINNNTSTYTSSFGGSWYVVYNTVEMYNIVFDGGDTHIILMDDATLNLYGSYNNDLIVSSGNLHIYGQSAGTGAIHGRGIDCFGSDIIINGGTLNVAYILTYGDLHINGGNITATNSIQAWDNIYLGWTKASDRISAGYYSCSYDIVVKDGQAFVDEYGNYYVGELTYNQKEALQNKTLSPFSDFDQQFSIIYHTKGGTLPDGYPQYYTYNTTVVLPVPTLDEQYFYGWYEQDEIRGDSLVEITAGTRLGDLDLYAFWGPQHVNVRYIDEDGVSQIANNATVLYGGGESTYPGGVYTLLQDAQYKNLSFTGNTTLILPDDMLLNVAENDFKSDKVSTITVDGNLTVYGQEDGDGALVALDMNVTGNVAIYGGETYVTNQLTATNITLSWTGMKNLICVKEYIGTVTAAKAFTIYDLDTETVTFLNAGAVDDTSIINEKGLLMNAPTINVSYIDENGDMRTTDATVLWGNETNLPGGTYTFILSRDIDHGISFSGNTTIIIPDETYLHFYGDNWDPLVGTAITVNGNLSVYGQIERTGSLDIDATYCIQATGNVIFGNVNAYLTGSTSGIVSGGDVSIIDGRCMCQDKGINTNNGIITLGYLTDRYEIISSAYNGMVRIRDGQMLCKDYAPNLPYTGVLSSDQVNEILNEYLVPSYYLVTLDVTGYANSTESDHWAFIASPIVGSTAPKDVWYLTGNQISFNQYDYDLYRLKSSNMMWENYLQHDSNHSPFALENGKGYLYANKNNVTLEFHGAYNTNTVQEVELEQGYNLVGNPFPVAAYVNRPFYKMNAEGTDIEAVSTYTTAIIPACNGVVVRAAGDDEAVTFSTTAPELLNGDKGSLQMTLAKAGDRGTGYQDKAIVSFNEGMQLSKFIFNEDHAKLYMPKNDKDYAIISSDKQEEIPIYFKANEFGTFNISFDGDMRNVKLIDKIEDQTVDLSADGSYTFIGSPSDRRDRFVIRFEGSNGSETSTVFAYQNGSDIIVNGEGELQMFDVMGRLVMQKRVNGVEKINAEAHGVYILKLNDKVQKIVVR